MKVLKKEFILPNENPNMNLGHLIDMKLHIHAVGVEEIADKATKEAKHEESLLGLEATWANVNFSMTYYKDTDLPLLKIEEDIVEQLESDQMAVQSIVGSRYGHFKQEAVEWQRALGAVSDVTQLLSELLRTWSYLEPLFIGSEEVKKELPTETTRFQEVDTEVRAILQQAWKTKSVKITCQEVSLLEKLHLIEKKQDECKKRLSEFLNGKRRQFPRFFFMSESDILGLLSNSSQPAVVLKSIDKVLLSIKELNLATVLIKTKSEIQVISFVSGVGSEIVKFEPPVRISGKVEVYLNSVLNGQIVTLANSLQESLGRYPTMSRIQWLMNKDNDDHPIDPSQIMLLVANIDFCNSVEKGMIGESEGNMNSMANLMADNIMQVTNLIGLTNTELSKGDIHIYTYAYIYV
jgi:dynein heavy chain